MPLRRGVLAALTVAVLTVGCTPSGGEPAPDSTPSNAPQPAATTTLSSPKRVGGQTLPASLGGWRLSKQQGAGAGATAYFYTSADAPKASLVATLTPVPLTPAALAAVLPDARPVGSATCGSLAGGPRTACYLPLQGGNLRLVAALGPDQLGPIAEQFYAALREG